MEHLIGKEVRIGGKYAEKHCYEPVVGKIGILTDAGSAAYSPTVEVPYGNHTIEWYIRKEDIYPVGAIDNEAALLYIERSDPFA